MNSEELEAFLHNLHFDIDKIRPPDLVVDWEDAPLPYKIYRGLPVAPFSTELPFTLDGRDNETKPKLHEIGHFLWYVFGLTQLCQSVFPPESTEESIDQMQLFRRFAPSGGALYPSELYVYLKIEDLPAGVYHYDVAHHRLVLLREGYFDAYLNDALGNRCEVSSCFGIVFVTTLFWKNFFKYNNFAYRLQGLDAGALIGQLLEVAKRFGFESGVYFQFLDQALNHLLGISEQEESVYAAIPLTVEPAIRWFANVSGADRTVSASELCRELKAVQHVHYTRSRRVREYPMLNEMNTASKLESTALFQLFDEKNEVDRKDQVATLLPYVERLSYRLEEVCRKRFSPGTDFIWGNISQTQLAVLLQETTSSFSYRNDLDGTLDKPEPRVSLYGCLHGIEGISDGAYCYDSKAHALWQVRPGDQRSILQKSSLNINLFHVPICLHVAGNKSHLQSLGYRGYRIQQMEAGMLVQRLLLSSCAIGMGGHPLLGFDAKAADEIYRMSPRGMTSLIQIPVGPHHYRSRLEGSLHS